MPFLAMDTYCHVVNVILEVFQVSYVKIVVSKFRQIWQALQIRLGVFKLTVNTVFKLCAKKQNVQVLVMALVTVRLCVHSMVSNCHV